MGGPGGGMMQGGAPNDGTQQGQQAPQGDMQQGQQAPQGGMQQQGAQGQQR